MSQHGAAPSNIEQDTPLIDISSRNVIRLAPGDSMGAAARIMAEKRISCIVVTDEAGHPLGILTERNMLHAMQSGRLQETPVAEVMAAPVISVPHSIAILDAYRLCLRNDIRHLVIVDENGVLDGVVSETDFRLHLNLTALAGRRKVTSIVRRAAVVLPPATGLRQALDLMQAQHKTCVVVVGDEKPLGIVTERDVVRLYSRGNSYADVTLGEAMVSPVLTIAHDATISEAAEKMLVHKVRHLVMVEEDGRMAGLLSEHDLTQTMVAAPTDARDGLEENFLRTLINTMPELVWLKDTDGVYLACNPRFERFFGAKEKDIIGKSDYDFVVKELADFFRAHDLKAMENDAPTVNEEWITFADDGHREFLETIKTPMRGSDGRLIGVLGIARDVTERIKAEETLRKLSAAVEQSGTSVVITDLEAHIQYVNSRFTENSGYSSDETIGQNPRFLQSGLTPKETYLELWDKLVEGREWNGELLNKRKNGELYWEDVSIAPIKNPQGAITHYVAVKTEITSRKRMESALAESEHRYRTLIENSPFCIHEIDLEGRLQSMNHAGLDMLGVDEDAKICGVPFFSFISEADGGRIKALLQNAINGNSSHFEFEAARDVPLYFKSCFIPIKDADGNVVKLMGITEDITESKRAAAEIRESEIKYRELFESAGDGIFIQNTSGFIDCNEKGASMYGLTRAEVIGRHPSTLAPERQPNGQLSADYAGEEIAAALAGEARQFEWQALRPGGVPVDVEITLSRIELKGEVCLQAVVRDISARKIAERALQESEEKLRNLFELSPLGIAMVDMKGRYIEFNEAFQRICGYGREELNKLDYWELTPRKYEEDEQRQLDSLASTGRYGPYDKEYVRKDGTLISLRLNGVLVTGKDGEDYIWSIVEDITESRRVEQDLQQGKARVEMLMNSVAEGIYGVDMNGDCTFVNSAALHLLGFQDEAELLGRNMHDLIHHSHQDGSSYPVAECRLYRCMQSLEEVHVSDEFFWRKDGSSFPVDYWSRPTTLNGETGAVVTFMDVADRKRAEESLRITASVFDTSQEAILITDANNIITDVNPAFTHITGYSREEVLGRNPKLLSSGRHDQTFYAAMWQSLKQTKAWRGEIWNRRKSGDVYTEMLSISVICDDAGNLQRHVGVFSDISYLKEHEAALRHIAHYDALTGIPNRMLLADRMKQAIAQTSREQNMLAVCYLDLDGFKPVNDALGHEAGDQVLIEIGKRLGNTIRGGDTVARLGGDEFVVLLLGLDRGDECMATLERLLAAIAEPFSVKDKQISLGASIGVSIYPLDDENPDTLLRHADQAMYVAKQSGKNRFYIYDAALDQRARNRNEFLQSIRSGLEQGQFELYYQPKINLRSGQLVGAEGLIRWRHPERGLLSPAEFLRQVENTELDIEIGNWVIATALLQIERWRQVGMDIEVSINISAFHLESDFFTEKLRAQVLQYQDMSHGSLQIEVLETVALNDIAIVQQVVEACHQFGVRFALDDFGTGFSSLSYLSLLPIDVLKIDQSFVRDMLEDKGDMAIVQGIIALAEVFGRETVAEGVETEEQQNVLRELGCDIAQGYWLAMPMTAKELVERYLSS